MSSLIEELRRPATDTDRRRRSVSVDGRPRRGERAILGKNLFSFRRASEQT